MLMRFGTLIWAINSKFLFWIYYSQCGLQSEIVEIIKQKKDIEEV
jgi:hypothetical protein